MAKARAAVRVLERDVEAEGDVRYDLRGALLSAEGRVKGAGGEGTLKVDFALGRVDVEGAGLLEVKEPVEASVRWSGRASGPLLGPWSAWTSGGGGLRADRVAWRGRALDDVAVEILEATPAGARWKATGRKGDDRAEAEGTVRIADPPVFEGTLRATVAQASAWVEELRAAEVRVDGRFSLGADARFDGRVSSGAGSAAGVSWTKLEASVAAGPDGVEVPDARVSGLPLLPELRGTASVDRLQGGAWGLRVDATSGADLASFDGTMGPGGAASGRFVLRGGFAAAGLPEALAPLDLGGTLEAREGAVRVRTAAGNGRLRHGPLEIEASKGRAELREVEAGLPERGLDARVSGALAWSDERVDVKAKAEGLRRGTLALGDLGAEVAVARATGEATGTLRWTSGRGDEATAEGRWGRELDVRVRGGAALATFGPADLKGRAEADLKITGTPGTPRIEGRVSAVGVAWGALEPGSAAATLWTDGRRLRARIEGAETAYGRLSGEGSWPLEGGKEGVEARVALETKRLDAAAPLLPEGLRAWIPAGEAELTAEAEGPTDAIRWRAAAVLRAAELKLPEPLAPVRGLELRASAVAGKPLRIDALTGRMGEGPFRASGTFDVASPERRLDLWFAGQQLLVVNRPLSHVRVRVDADLTWTAKGGARLEGLIAVPIALIHEEPSLSGGGSTDPRRALSVGGLRLRPAPGGGVLLPGIPELKDLALDLRVRSTGEIRVENSVVGARLSVDGRIDGNGAQPAAHGTVRALRGEVKLPGAIFVRIVEARADIPRAPGAEPSVHFEGRVGAGEGAVGILVEGPLASPTLDLRSDPPRPREQLLAELAFGHGTGAVAGDAALGALAFRVVDQYAAGWPSADPKDGFFQRIRPTVINDEDAGPRPPWELPSSRPARGLIVRTEYVLTPYFSVVGEADGEANVGGDLKLRLRFR